MAPGWMTGAMDRVFAGCPDVKEIRFDFWPDGDGREGPILKGMATFHVADGRMVPDDLLDDVLGVRILERRAAELWRVIPMNFSEGNGFSLNGRVGLAFAREGTMEMSYHPDDWDGAQSYMEVRAARGDDRAWSIDERLVMDHYDGSASDLMIDANAAMRSCDISGMGLSEHPRALSVHVDEDGLHHFRLAPGELSRVTPER
jgi:hypothetical protein